jgi:hypothetical protein
MPTYFIGWIQSVLGLNLNPPTVLPSTEGASCSARSATWTVRHGVVNGAWPRTSTPSPQGARSACQVRSSIRAFRRFIRA